MLTQPIPIPMPTSRIDGGPGRSAIPTSGAASRIGRLLLINGGKTRLYGARCGWPTPFDIPVGQAATIESTAETETISVFNSDGRGPVGHYLDRKTFPMIAERERRVRWTGYRWTEED